MNEKEMTEYIQGEIKYIPCFSCIDGFLDLKEIEFLSKVNIALYCGSCGEESEMQFDLI